MRGLSLLLGVSSLLAVGVQGQSSIGEVFRPDAGAVNFGECANVCNRCGRTWTFIAEDANDEHAYCSGAESTDPGQLHMKVISHGQNYAPRF